MSKKNPYADDEAPKGAKKASPKKPATKRPSAKKKPKSASAKGKASRETSKNLPATEKDGIDALGLEPRHRLFVTIYCSLSNAYNGTRAYLQAYGLDHEKDYASAAACATRLLKSVKIIEAVRMEKERVLSNHDQITKRWLEEVTGMAFANVHGLVEVVGGRVALRTDLTDEQMRTVESLSNGEMGLKLTFHNKSKNLELLGRALGLFTENVRNVGDDYESLVMRLAREESGKKT